jgi:hypothetical protein
MVLRELLSRVALTWPMNEAMWCDERNHTWNVIGNFSLFVFKQCVWPTQGPCCSAPARASDIMILDTPRGDLVEISSSSYSLSFFSLKAASHHNENAGAVPRGSWSLSIGELWPNINQLDETGREGTSMVAAQGPPIGPVLRSHMDFRGLERAGDGTSCVARRASVDEALGPSSAPPRGCGGSSTKKKLRGFY